MKLLNVAGSNSELPEEYVQYEQTLLDIDPRVEPDIVLDAMEIANTMEAEQYDIVWCSHGIEHFYAHQVPYLMYGFWKVLKIGGKCILQVPNMKQWIRDLVSRDHEITDTWYRTKDGTPVTYHDVLYGWGPVMAKGNLFYAHKSAYTPWSICQVLHNAGFQSIAYSERNDNLWAEGVKCL